PFRESEIVPTLPFRLIGLGTRSGYSSVTFGLRPFDLAAGPVDRIRAEIIAEREPEREDLPMDAPDAVSHIVSGVHELENTWRWMGERAVFLLKSPATPLPLRVSLYIPGQAPARAVRLTLDGVPVAEAVYEGEGSYVLATPEPVAPEGE